MEKQALNNDAACRKCTKAWRIKNYFQVQIPYLKQSVTKICDRKNSSTCFAA